MNSSSSSPSSADWGVLLLRVSLGILFLAHSIVLKLVTYGADGTAQFFVGVGLPGWLAYVTIVWELLGGILLGALFFVHLANGWVFTNTNGGWEYPAYLFVLCMAQALLGDGPYAVKIAPAHNRRKQLPAT